jgi:thiol-disulfide isomerase/thioredoxin
MRYAFLFFYLFSILFAFRPAQADGPPLDGEMSRFNFSTSEAPFSNVSLTDQDDNQSYLSQFRGKVVVLNVWASWCGPCVMEMPGLDHLQASFSSNDLAVVPVSIDRGGAHQAMPYLNRMNVHAMTPYFDHSNSIGRLLGASRIPVTVIIGRDGNEIGRFIGTTEWDSEEAKSLIKYFINNGGEAGRVRAVSAATNVSMSR